MLRWSWSGGLLTLVFVAFPALGQDTGVKLVWKFNKGDQFFLQTDSSAKQTMRTPSLGKELKLDVDQTTVFSVTVRDINADKSVVLEYKIVDEKLQQQLLGAGFTITLGAKGEVKKFEGYDDLVKKVAGDDANAQKLFRAVVSEAELKARATDAFGFLPDGPVKLDTPSAKWQRKSELPLGPLGSFEVTKSYTYEGPAKAPSGKAEEKIRFQGEAKYSLPAKTDGTPVLPFQVAKGDLRAENFKGDIFFDAAAGRLDSSDMTVTLKGNVSFAGQGGSGNIDTEVSVEQTIKTKWLDKNPLAPK
jgi:hypothetical protein